MSIFITEQAWDRATKKAEKENLKASGHSLTRCTISNKAGLTHILEVRADGLIVKEDWRKAIKEASHAMKYINFILVLACLTGCNKFNHPFTVLGSLSGPPLPSHKAIGAGQSNMANMNLADFQRDALDIVSVSNIAVGGSSLSEWVKG